jgi:hypothetical protein
MRLAHRLNDGAINKMIFKFKNPKPKRTQTQNPKPKIPKTQNPQPQTPNPKLPKSKFYFLPLHYLWL